MQLRRGQFWSTFWVLALLLAGLVTWFLSNLLYTLFWKLLGDWRIPLTEGQMTTYIAANLIPFMCVLLAAAILAILIRNHMAFVDNATGAADPIAQAGKRRKTVTGPPTSAGIDLASIGLIPPESVVIEDEIVVQYWSSRSHIYGRPEAQNTADSP